MCASLMSVEAPADAAPDEAPAAEAPVSYEAPETGADASLGVNDECAASVTGVPPAAESVRVVLRIRPLLRREYGYPLAAEKLAETRRARRRRGCGASRRRVVD